MEMKGYSFSEEGHAHYWDGKRMYGVTSVLRVFGEPNSLISWAANCAVDHIEKNATRTGAMGVTNEPPYGIKLGDYIVPETMLEEARTAHTKKRDSAGDTGKTFHKVLEDAMNDWIEEGKPIYTEDNVANKTINWLYDNGYKPVKAEFPCYSVSNFVAGIADGIVEKEGKYMILDFKTGNSIQPTAFIQCSAYSSFLKEMELYQCSGVIVMHIPRGKKLNEPMLRYDIDKLEATWWNIFEAYKVYKNLKEAIKY